MRYLAALLLIASFAGIGLLGFTLVDHAMVDGLNNNCVASALDGTECPANIVARTSHHISAVQAFTTTLPASFDWLLLLASLLLVSVSIFLFYKDLSLPKLESLPQRLRDLALHSLYSKQKIISWLSLFELSPSL